MPINATQLRAGMLIKHQNELFRLMQVTHITPGNKRGLVQTKMRNIRTGVQTENRFRSEDTIDRVSLEQEEMEFLYESQGLYHFMNTHNYEQIELGSDLLGEATKFLRPNLRISVEFYEGRPIGVSLPKTVDLEIADTAPAMKTATVTSQLKPATTATGLTVQVPSFINTGDEIRVDTETGEYLSRAK